MGFRHYQQSVGKAIENIERLDDEKLAYGDAEIMELYIQYAAECEQCLNDLDAENHDLMLLNELAQ